MMKIEGFHYEQVYEMQGITLWRSTKNPDSFAIRPYCAGYVVSSLLSLYLQPGESTKVYWSERGYPYQIRQFAHVVRLASSGTWLWAGLKNLLGYEDVGIIERYGPMRVYQTEYIDYGNLGNEREREVGSEI